jgi:hypothetical protein
MTPKMPASKLTAAGVILSRAKNWANQNPIGL